MIILDLFCGAGGAAMGYHQAFPDAEIVGVDIEPQPDYPFTFIQADALVPIEGTFDLVHASPPCQSYTGMTNRYASAQPELIEQTRAHIMTQYPDSSYVIENVVGSGRHLNTNLMLCGSMFGLPVRRHRLFETSWLIWQPDCRDHTGHIPIYGRPDGRRLFGELRAWTSLEQGRQAMQVEWMTNWHSIREAIPPAYTRYIGESL